eukprot:m.215895 g.215895  ORF g.215895 m.215895 type:complete len:717 (-) comp10150_c0_seq10:600-2750(-)
MNTWFSRRPTGCSSRNSKSTFLIASSTSSSTFALTSARPSSFCRARNALLARRLSRVGSGPRRSGGRNSWKSTSRPAWTSTRMRLAWRSRQRSKRVRTSRALPKIGWPRMRARRRMAMRRYLSLCGAMRNAGPAGPAGGPGAGGGLARVALAPLARVVLLDPLIALADPSNGILIEEGVLVRANPIRTLAALVAELVCPHHCVGIVGPLVAPLVVARCLSCIRRGDRSHPIVKWHHGRGAGRGAGRGRGLSGLLFLFLLLLYLCRLGWLRRVHQLAEDALKNLVAVVLERERNGETAGQPVVVLQELLDVSLVAGEHCDQVAVLTVQLREEGKEKIKNLSAAGAVLRRQLVCLVDEQHASAALGACILQLLFQLRDAVCCQRRPGRLMNHNRLRHQPQLPEKLGVLTGNCRLAGTRIPDKQRVEEAVVRAPLQLGDLDLAEHLHEPALDGLEALHVQQLLEGPDLACILGELPHHVLESLARCWVSARLCSWLPRSTGASRPASMVDSLVCTVVGSNLAGQGENAGTRCLKPLRWERCNWVVFREIHKTLEALERFLNHARVFACLIEPRTHILLEIDQILVGDVVGVDREQEVGAGIIVRPPARLDVQQRLEHARREAARVCIEDRLDKHCSEVLVLATRHGLQGVDDRQHGLHTQANIPRFMGWAPSVVRRLTLRTVPRARARRGSRAMTLRIAVTEVGSGFRFVSVVIETVPS